jgi:hypothetical protein
MILSITAFSQLQEEPSSNLPRNSMVISNDFLWSITASYERITPVTKGVYFVGRIGAGITGEYGMNAVLMINPSLIAGGRRSFAELGIAYYQPIPEYPVFIPTLGYRYIGPKGFSLKINAEIHVYTSQEDINEWGQYEFGPMIHLGYRFKLKSKSERRRI